MWEEKGRTVTMRAMVSALVLVTLAATAQPASALDGDASGVTGLARLFTGVPYRVALVNPIAYVALDTGLQLFDVSDALNPITLGHVYLPGPALDLAVVGNYAYIAAGEAGLQVIDVANAASPMWVGSLAAPGARSVVVQGSVAYLGQSFSMSPAVLGVRTVDVSNPRAPAALGFAPLPVGPIDIAVSGATVFAGAGTGSAGHGLYAIDVTDPRAPVAIPGGFVATGKPVNEIAIQGGIAYLATGYPATGALVTVNIGVPSAPALLGSFPLADGARGVSVGGVIAMVAARSLGVITFNVSDPRSPFVLDTLQTGRETVAVVSRGDVVFLAERSSIEQAGFTAVDTVNPSMLRMLASAPFAEATAVAAAPGLAYLLRRDALHVFDASAPEAPVWLSSWRPPRGDFSALAVGGGLAAVADGARVTLVDVADPRNPMARGTVTVSLGVAVRVQLSGSVLYVVTGAGLETFDVSSASSPTPLGAYATSGWSSDLAIAGNTGYLTAGGTLHVLELGNPALPTALGSVTVPGELFYGVAAAGDTAVVAAYGKLLYTVDVAIATSPRLVASLAGPSAFDVTLAGESALVAAGTAGLMVVSVTDPANPVLVGYYDTSGYAGSIAGEGEYVYLASYEAQHWLLRCEVCAVSCAETWPTIVANSLRGVKEPGDQRFHWQVVGSGSTNLHRTLDKRALPSLHADQATYLDFTPTTTITDTYVPASNGVALYRVFGRGSCTGLSYAP